MTDLRAQIDRIDQALVKLLSERQRYIERAAEIKSLRENVRDEARIADVMAKVLAEAARSGLSHNIAAPVWEILIDRSIALEEETFDAIAQAGKA